MNKELIATAVNNIEDDEYYVEELIESIYDTTKTRRIIDRFEGIRQKEGICYRRLVIKNGKYCRHISNEWIYFNLVIERDSQIDTIFAGSITFTRLKKDETGDLQKYVEDEITNNIAEQYKDKKVFYRFPKPFLLRAQNSNKRYGETTNYSIVGTYVSTDYMYNPKDRIN